MNTYNMIGNNKGKLGKILSILATSLILFLLVFSAPAKAFVLNLSSDKSEVSRGNTITFTASISISSSENLDVSQLVLDLNGVNGKNYTCTFDKNGAILSGCLGMGITKISGPDYKYGYGYNTVGYGYGYGFNNGILSYRIVLDTEDYQTGDYNTKLTADIGSNHYSQSGSLITINSGGSSSEELITGNNYRVTESISYDRICLNAWQCSDWTACTDGLQTRTCSQTMASCILSNKPMESRQCGPVIKLGGGLADPYANLIPQNSNEEEINAERTPGITGAVIGSGLSNPFIIFLLSIIIVLMALVIGVALIRRIEYRRKISRMRRLNQMMYRPGK